jgi:hypothetical protein
MTTPAAPDLFYYGEREAPIDASALNPRSLSKLGG